MASLYKSSILSAHYHVFIRVQLILLRVRWRLKYCTSIIWMLSMKSLQEWCQATPHQQNSHMYSWPSWILSLRTTWYSRLSYRCPCPFVVLILWDFDTILAMWDFDTNTKCSNPTPPSVQQFGTNTPWKTGTVGVIKFGRSILSFIRVCMDCWIP